MHEQLQLQMAQHLQQNFTIWDLA